MAVFQFTPHADTVKMPFIEGNRFNTVQLRGKRGKAKGERFELTKLTLLPLPLPFAQTKDGKCLSEPSWEQIYLFAVHFSRSDMFA
jgi:hypothetical protein